MRRLVWVAIGAAGGIVVYRRAQQALADARERGLVQSAQQVGMSAAGALTAARTLAAGATASGAAAARVIGSPGARGADTSPRRSSGDGLR